MRWGDHHTSGWKIGVVITIRDADGNLLDLYCHSSSMTETGPERGISLYSPLRAPYPEGTQVKIEVFR